MKGTTYNPKNKSKRDTEGGLRWERDKGTLDSKRKIEKTIHTKTEVKESIVVS